MRHAIRLPLIVFALHALLVAGSAWMAMRSPNNPLANVYFLPVMFIDMPFSLLSMPAEPLINAISVWLAPTVGKGEAAILTLAVWLGVTGPWGWMLLAWLMGGSMDTRRARVAAPAAGSVASAPPTVPPAREERAA